MTGDSTDRRNIYASTWSYQNLGLEPEGDFSAPIALNFVTVNIPRIRYASPTSASVLLSQRNLECIPFRSLYAINNTYVNSVQTLNYTITPIELLPHVNAITINGTTGGGPNATEATLGGIEWNSTSQEWFRDAQLMGVVNGMAWTLVGNVTSSAESQGDFFDWSSLSLATLTGNDTAALSAMIPYMRFASNFHNYSFPFDQEIDPPISFTVKEDLVNRVFGDYIVSMIPAFAAWNETINVTSFDSYNVYSYSSPADVWISYGLCLFFSLISIVLGSWALHENGIPATDGGFIQLLSTTTGSSKLQRAAAMKCLGGGQDLPKSLTGLKIRYGELVDMQVEHGGEVMRRAGFGAEDEDAPLKKGHKYGVVHNAMRN